MQLTIELDDQMLADFYQSMGANPVAEWTQEEKDKWLRVNFLEPFIHKSVIEQGRQVRKQTAEISIMEEFNRTEKVIEDKLTEIISKAQLELPEKLKGEVIIKAEPATPIVEGFVKASSIPKR